MNYENRKAPIYQITVNHRVIYGPQDLSHEQVARVNGLTEDRKREYPEMPSRAELEVTIQRLDEVLAIINCNHLLAGEKINSEIDRISQQLNLYGITTEQVLAMIKC